MYEYDFASKKIQIKILDGNFNLQKNRGRKRWGKKKIGPKTTLWVQIQSFVKIMFAKENFGYKNIGTKKLLGQKMFCSPIFVFLTKRPRTH